MSSVYKQYFASNKKIKYKAAAARGFTIVEMLLGIGLFGLLLPALITSFTAISALNDASKDLAIANIVAENKIEELRSIGYNSIPTGTINITSTLPTTLGRNRSGSYTVTNDTPGQKVITLSLTIEGRKSTKTLNYRSIIGELGVGQ